MDGKGFLSQPRYRSGNWVTVSMDCRWIDRIMQLCAHAFQFRDVIVHMDGIFMEM